MFAQHPSELSQHISKNQELKLEVGEISANGQFIELKYPKTLKEKHKKTKKVSSELLFFEIISQQNEYNKLLSQLLNAITEYNRSHPPLWSDESSFFGINIAVPLSSQNPEYIPELIHFLSSTNINQEIALEEDLNHIFRSTDWSSQTLDLLAARSTIIKGSSGHQQITKQLESKSLQHYFENEQNQNKLLEKITIYALLNYAEKEGKESPQRTIEDALAPFIKHSEAFEHKCRFLIRSFVDHFPDYLPINKTSLHHPNFR